MSARVRLLLVVGGLALMGALVARVGVATILGMISHVGWSFAAVVGFYCLHATCRALVLYVAVGGHGVTFVDVLRIRFSGEAVEALTYTGPLLAEPAKGMLLTNRGVPTINAFAAISLEFLLYSVTSAAVGAVGAALLLRNGSLTPGLHNAAVALLAAMLVFIAATILAAVTGVGLIAPSLRAMNAMIGHDRIAATIVGIADVERELVGFLHYRVARVALSVVLEFASHGFMMAEVWIMLRALSLAVSFRDLLIIEGSTKLVAFVFFFVPAQLGATEGGNALIFPLLGLPVAAGLTIALVRRIRSMCIAAIGLVAGGTMR
jgi:hypothetical protein